MTALEDARAAAEALEGLEGFAHLAHTDLAIKARDALVALIAEYERLTERLAVHQKLGLAAIFLADTFDEGADPDSEMSKIRNEWLAERLTAPPADDEREAPTVMVSEPFTGSTGVSVVYVSPYADMTPSLMVDGLILPPNSVTALREFFRRQGPITDAQVHAAQAILYDDWREGDTPVVRQALEAAREADR